MTTAAITPVLATTPDLADQAVGTIVLAFSDDPVVRWTWPDLDRYLVSWPRVIRAFGGRAFPEGTAHHVADFAGAALWLPPGVEPDTDAIMAEFERSVPQERFRELLDMFERMGAAHPAGAHWYLPLIGVDPVHQGRGYGAALLQHALEICDRGHLPAYLESTNSRNISLYERHGFEVVDTIQVGSSPPVFPMVRAAR